MRGDDALLWLVVAFLAWVAIFGFIGYAVGKGKGRGGLGWALGCLLGFIGVIIVAVLPATPEYERRRYALITGQDPDRPPTPAGPSPDELRQQAVAEVVRRDPSLASASDPDSLKRLAAATATVEEELRVKAALEAVQLQQAKAAADAKAQEERDAEEVKSAKEEAQRRADAARQQQERDERVQALPPARRWVAQHRALTAALVVLVVAGIATTVTIAMVGAARDRETAAQQAADQRAAEEREAATAQAAADSAAHIERVKASCDIKFAVPPGGELDVYVAWAQCPDPKMRFALANRARLLPMEAAMILAADSETDVRLALATQGAWPEVLEILASDADPGVRVRVAKNENTPDSAIEELARDGDATVSVAAMDTLDPDPCASGVVPANRVTGTTWYGWQNGVDRFNPDARERFAVRFNDDCTWREVSPTNAPKEWDDNRKWSQKGRQVVFTVFDIYHVGRLSGDRLVGEWRASGSGRFVLSRS